MYLYAQACELLVESFPQTRLIDVPPAQRFTKFGRIAWNRVFFKTFFEKRSSAHLLVNFNRVWIIHIAVFWFYTAFNSPKVYAPKNAQSPSAPMTWSATALGGAVATLIMIAATIAEFSYIPTTWNNAGHHASSLGKSWREEKQSFHLGHW